MALSEMLPVLILTFSLAYASVDIVDNNLAKTCIYVEGSQTTIDKFSNFFTDSKIKPFGSISYCTQLNTQNALESISKCGCFSNYTQEIVVFTDDSGSELASLIGNENMCTKILQNTINRMQFESDNEYFIYGKNKKICFLSENLLGIGCDSTKEDTFYDASTTDYSIFDIPEITYNGFLIHTTDVDAYFCYRKDSNPTHTITWFTTADPSMDQISMSRSWSTFWKKLTDVVNFCAKVLDLFVSSGIIRRL